MFIFRNIIRWFSILNYFILLILFCFNILGFFTRSAVVNKKCFLHIGPIRPWRNYFVAYDLRCFVMALCVIAGVGLSWLYIFIVSILGIILKWNLKINWYRNKCLLAKEISHPTPASFEINWNFGSKFQLLFFPSQTALQLI